MSNEMKHTPGSWEVDSGGLYTKQVKVTGPRGARVVICRIPRSRRSDAALAADAKLIAAAPELLRAVQAVLAAIESQAKDTIWILPPFQASGVHESAVERLQFVIHKAL